MGKFINGDHVRIISGPAAGLTGVVGGTLPDGRVEVITPDLSGPASEEDEAFSEDDLEEIPNG